LDLGNGFGLHLSDANKRMAMEAHKKLDTPAKLAKKVKSDLSLVFKGHSQRGGLAGGHGAATKAAVRNGAAREYAKNHLIGDDGFPGSGFMDPLLCNHINVMEDLIDSQDLVEVNSVYIKQDQLHGDMETTHLLTSTRNGVLLVGATALMATSRITEFGAANAEDTVPVTDLQPIPSAGRERTKKQEETTELRVAMEWVIARCPEGRPLHQYISGGGYLDGSYHICHILAPT
jgi:hypothetical protein